MSSTAAARYDIIRPDTARIHDRPMEDGYQLSSELELQARWFAGEFGRHFHTHDGLAVEIVQFGVWNHEAGPDFTDAAIAVDGGPAQRGCIEIDSHPRDWEAHGHAQNPAFNSVVLHVVGSASTARTFIRTLEHRNIPQVVLDLSRLDPPPSATLPSAKPGRCSAPLREASAETVRDIIHAAARFRLETKAKRLAKLADAHGIDEALYQSLAAALGYKHNKLPFTVLAQRMPIKHLHRNPETIEAELLGTAGFLSMPDLGQVADDTRSYLRTLWDEWWRLRSDSDLLTVPADAWTLGGSRPINHPQRRVAALAAIAVPSNWRQLRNAADSGEAKQVTAFFHSLEHTYWQHHYTLTSKPSARPMALVGDTRIAEILANVLYPWLHAQGRDIFDSYSELRARLGNRTLETAAIRLFGGKDAARDITRSVAGQQGLLQIYQDFCLHDASDCRDCTFPERAAEWK